MEHLIGILWFLSWPALIFIAYKATLFLLKKTNLYNK